MSEKKCHCNTKPEYPSTKYWSLLLGSLIVYELGVIVTLLYLILLELEKPTEQIQVTKGETIKENDEIKIEREEENKEEIPEVL